MTDKTIETFIEANEALGIAELDAHRAYDDLSPYRIEIVLEDDGWHVDYMLRDPGMTGGGPHYVIDAASGEIRSRRYEQ